MVRLLTVGILAFLFSIFSGSLIIRVLKHLEMGQKIRGDGPARHLKKEGVPTMGGVIILLGVVLGILLTHSLTQEILWLFFITLGFGLIGLLDDLIKVIEDRSLGLRAWQKITGQLLLSFIFSLHLLGTSRGDLLLVPFTGGALDLGIWAIPFSMLVIIGTANAVNLTDGLDGLAAGITATTGLALSILLLLLGYRELAPFALALSGASLGFCWFNGHPAQVIMGDTGSLALGGALAGLALLSDTPLFLVIAGGLFVLETISVIIQVISFQTTGRRLFRMTPIHHHFELLGWEEPKIVIRFWLLSFLLVLVTLLGLLSHL